MDKAVFGLIGAGGIAQSQHLPNLARAPHVRLKTLCDLREEVLGPMQAKYAVPHATTDYRELLADPEIQAVVVATREDAQARLAIEALRAGKHVYSTEGAPGGDQHPRRPDGRGLRRASDLRLARRPAGPAVRRPHAPGPRVYS